MCRAAIRSGELEERAVVDQRIGMDCSALSIGGESGWDLGGRHTAVCLLLWMTLLLVGGLAILYHPKLGGHARVASARRVRPGG